jgi:hypothetical protein
MIKQVEGKVSALTLYADNKYRVSIDGDNGSGHITVVCEQNEIVEFHLGQKVQLELAIRKLIPEFN